MVDTQALRLNLHRTPELSNQERGTAEQIIDVLKTLKPDQLLTGIGGYGVLAMFNMSKPGKHILIRCELDALPIQETNQFEHCSQHQGVSHKCGHDGHMSILIELAKQLTNRSMASGQVTLLFQPAEETGSGAAAVLAEPQFQSLSIDYAFALHNMPGYPLGSVVIRPGTMTCASRGMIIRFEGKTAHAAQPETGRSPALAMTSIINELCTYVEKFGHKELALATVVGSKLGSKAFGTAPAHAEIYVTLRSETENTMQAMLSAIEQQAQQLCQQYTLTFESEFEDVFPATVNTVGGAELIRQAAINTHNELIELDQPIRWSEDFGHLIQGREGGLFGLGAGEQQPALHNPDYDFPDGLITRGASVFLNIIEQCLN